jgi:four helix bundle protein
VGFADDLEARLYRWAIAVVRFCRTVMGSAEGRDIASQLRRSSASASANYRASRRGRSNKEWLAKIGVVIEELDESEHWLAFLSDSGLATPPQDLRTECRELRAILATSQRTAKARFGRQ